MFIFDLRFSNYRFVKYVLKHGFRVTLATHIIISIYKTKIMQ